GVHGMGLTFNPAVMGTGAKSIDDQHRQLVDIINHLLLSMAGGKAKDEVGPILNDLAKYATTHFAHEEQCMVRFSCPVAQQNKDAHAAFVKTFLAMKADFDRDGPTATMAIRMQRELSDWIAQHIVGVDVKLRPCIPAGMVA
ncbi:MAG: hemerythrin family protein, partial [Chloroflexota bacterium]